MALKRLPIILLLAYFLALGILALYMASPVNVDDAYITFRYAQNISQGKGFVYNPGERIQGTSTPLYTLILALMDRIGIRAHIAGNVIYVLSVFLILLFAFLILKSEGHPVLGFLLSGFIPLDFLLVISKGMETALYTALILGSVYFYARRRLSLSAVFMALLVVTRLDGIMLAGLIFLHYLFTERKLPIKAAFFFLALAFPWFLFSVLYFGSPLPVTLKAKILQGKSDAWASFFMALPPHFGHAHLLALIFLAFLSVLLHKARTGLSSRILVLPLWIVLYMTVFSASRVPNYHWYYIPPLITIYLLSFLALGHLSSLLSRRLSLFRRVLAGAVILIPIFLVQFNRSWPLHNRRVLSPQDLYFDVNEWLAKNTEKSDTVGAIEIGIIGYNLDRRIIDFCGLITPECQGHLLEDVSLWAIEHFKPDVMLLPFPAWGQNRQTYQSTEFMSNYWLAHSFSHPAFLHEYHVFKRTGKEEGGAPSSTISWTFTEAFFKPIFSWKYTEENFSWSYVKDGSQLVKGFSEHPQKEGPTDISFPVIIPQGAALEFICSLRHQPQMRSRGDGVTFEISFATLKERTVLFNKHLLPNKGGLLPEREPSARESLDLSRFEKQEGFLVFTTYSGPSNNADYDWAWWLDPCLTGKSNDLFLSRKIALFTGCREPDFSSTTLEECPHVNQIRILHASERLLEATGGDPYLIFPGNPFSGLPQRKVILSMKVEHAERERDIGQIFWITEDNKIWGDANRYITFDVIADGGMHTYEIDLSQKKEWLLSPAILFVRFDPITQPGVVSIEEFRIL